MPLHVVRDDQPEALPGAPDAQAVQGPAQQPEQAAEAGQSRFTFQDEEIDEHPELVNLAKYMSDADLKTIGQRCYEEYKQDEDSRTDWLSMQEQWVNLYHGKLKPVDPPWENASDDHLPILAEGCTQFHSRAYKAFFATFNFVSALPVGSVREDDKQRAERVGKYMSWQLGVRDKTYKRRKDRLLKALPLHGSYFTKTYRDMVGRRVMVENVSPLDMVVNYTCIGTDIEDLERKTQRIYLPQRLGRFYASAATNNYFLRPPGEIAPSDEQNTVRTTLDRIQGIKPPVMSDYRPSLILEQHRYLDLDGDGIEEPYIVWVDSVTQEVLRIAIRWSWDAWLRSNYKQPLEYFTHYVYIENPDGFYGFGQGHLTGDLNIACDKLLRQIINSATLQTSRPGFATQQTGIKSGKIEVKPGQVKKLNTSVNLRESLMFLDQPGPSEAMVKMMQLMTNRADRMNMVTDLLTGQPEKVYQTGATNSLIEQGLAVFSSVQIRVHAALEQELAKVARLNGIYLDEEEYFVFNDGQTEQEFTVYRTDFNDDLQVRPAFDPSQLTERERKEQAALEYKVALSNPLIARSPVHIEVATRRFFEALGSKNLDELVPDVEAQQQQGGGPPNPEQVAAQTAQQELAIRDRESQARVIGQQADMALDAEGLKLDERRVANEERKTAIREAEVALKARQSIKELGLNTVKTAADVEAKLRQSLNTSPPSTPGAGRKA
jgi:hypothetical protein